MRDFFETNTGRRGTNCIAPALAAAAPSLIAGGLSLAGGIFGGNRAQKQAGKQFGRDVKNQATLSNIQAQQAQGQQRSATLADVGSSFGGAQGGFNFGDEFLTEADARGRGLISNGRISEYFHAPGKGVWQNFDVTRVDPRLQQTTRTRLSPELETIRQQALGFQGAAGTALQGGFQGIDTGIAERELEILNQLAGPRDAERREQLFGMLQRTGRLESTPGASIFRGAEEAIGREGLRRELSARDIARGERDSALQANMNLFGLGSETTSNLANIENMIANRQLATSAGLRGQALPSPGIQLPSSPTGSQGSPIAGVLAGLAPQVAQMDFSSLFGGGGNSGGGEDFLASNLLPSSSKADQLFGRF